MAKLDKVGEVRNRFMTVFHCVDSLHTILDSTQSSQAGDEVKRFRSDVRGVVSIFFVGACRSQLSTVPYPGFLIRRLVLITHVQNKSGD